MAQPDDLSFLHASTPPAVDALGLTPEQKAALLQSIADAEAQFQAGETICGDEVLAWIRSWGTENPLPAPALKRRP